MHCKDCEYWDKTSDKNFRDCNKIPSYYKEGESDSNEIKIHKAFTCGSDSWKSSITTREDFGCVLFFSKEETTKQEKMFFRPHRGLLSEAMEQLVELPKTKEALENHIKEIFKDFKDYWTPEDIKIQLYSDRPDTRIGWEKTYIVFDKVGVIGFTNKEV